MNDPLARIEDQLLGASRRYVARRRARHRTLVAAAVIAALLAVASVASAVSGVGPIGGIFVSDEFAPPSVKPEPGGRRALLRATGPGGQRWDLLVYRTQRSLTRQRGLRDYCLAVARAGARQLPPGVLKRPPLQPEVYGFDSISCEYPPTFAARILRRGIEVRSGGANLPTDARSRTYPVYGLVLADARRVSVRQGAGRAVRAKLSRAFRFEIPRVPPRVRRQIESASQRRATRGLPASLKVRAYLAVVGPRPRPATLKVTASFASGHREVVRLRSRPAPRPRAPLAPPVTPDTRPPPGRPQVELQSGSGQARWVMRGFDTRDGVTCITARHTAHRPSPGDSSACPPWGGIALGLSRSRIFANRADTVRSPGTYPVYGLARNDVRKVTVIDPRGRPWRAELSAVWKTLVRPRNYLAAARGGFARRLRRLPRSVRLRAFLVVVPSPPRPGTGRGLRFRVTLADGRTLKGR